MPVSTDSASAFRMRIVALTIGLNIVIVALLTLAPWSDWRTGLALNVIDNLILISAAIRKRDPILAKLMLFGLIVGFLELPTDAWIVQQTKSLDYAFGGGPMLWKSPMWMPLAWEVVAVQFGCIGMWLWDRFSIGGVLLTALLGAINIPYYEEMALKIHWWRYHNTAMFPGTHTPWAIIIGEFLIAGYICFFAQWLRLKGIVPTLVAGLFAGVSLFGSYALPYMLIGE